jgi:ATP-dependent Clp protease ATP-binding subunit ClpA
VAARVLRYSGVVLERFTEDARSVVARAERAAHATGSQRASTTHLLLALLDAQDYLAAELRERGISHSLVARRMQSVSLSSQPSDPEQGQFTNHARAALATSLRQALVLGQNEVSPEHILLALASLPASVAGELLHGAGLDVTEIRSVVARQRAAELDGYFASLPLMPGHDLQHVLVSALGFAERAGGSEISLAHLLMALARNHELPLLRRVMLDEATILDAIGDVDPTWSDALRRESLPPHHRLSERG